MTGKRAIESPATEQDLTLDGPADGGPVTTKAPAESRRPTRRSEQQQPDAPNEETRAADGPAAVATGVTADVASQMGDGSSSTIAPMRDGETLEANSPRPWARAGDGGHQTITASEPTADERAISAVRVAPQEPASLPVETRLVDKVEAPIASGESGDLGLAAPEPGRMEARSEIASASSTPTSSSADGAGAARQVAQALLDVRDRNHIELRLDPPELGDVSIDLRLDDKGGVTAVVAAERPETLDLLRRHADLLSRQLGEMGFARADLTFGEGGGRDGQGNAPRRGVFIDFDTDHPASGAVRPAAPADRLDIRL